MNSRHLRMYVLLDSTGCRTTLSPAGNLFPPRWTRCGHMSQPRWACRRSERMRADRPTHVASDLRAEVVDERHLPKARAAGIELGTFAQDVDRCLADFGYERG